MLQRWTEEREAAHLYTVMVAIRNAADLPLVALACELARARRGKICVLYVATSNSEQPAWLQMPSDCQNVPVDIVTRTGRSISQVILDEVTRREPDVLVLGWHGNLGRGRYMLGRTLDPVVQSAACDVVVLRGDFAGEVQRVLIPAAGGPNAPRAFGIARALAPEGELTIRQPEKYVALEADFFVGKMRPLDLKIGRIQGGALSTRKIVIITCYIDVR